MIKYKIILYFSLSAMMAIFLSCREGNNPSHDRIYKTKGFIDGGVYRLKPVILDTGGEILGLVGTGIDNTLGTLNNEGEFCSLTISSSGVVKRRVVTPGFPPHNVLDINSDGIHNMIWQLMSGGISILDMDTKMSRTLGITSAVDESVTGAFLADPGKRIMHITVSKTGENDTKRYFILYDFVGNRVLYRSPLSGLYFHPFNGAMLYQEFPDTKRPNHFVWGMCDLQSQKRKTNGLTLKLTSLHIDINPDIPAIHAGQKIFIGSAMKGDTPLCYAVRWDSSFHATAVPLSGARICDDAMISPDGKWIKTFDAGTSGTRPELIIYSADIGHQGGLSFPIRCGYSHGNNKGAFVNHREWGPCYVDYDMEYPYLLFVFKLQEGLKLAKQHSI